MRNPSQNSDDDQMKFAGAHLVRRHFMGDVHTCSAAGIHFPSATHGAKSIPNSPRDSYGVHTTTDAYLARDPGFCGGHASSDHQLSPAVAIFPASTKEPFPSEGPMRHSSPDQGTRDCQHTFVGGSS